eukprot:CAMPEP_0194051630 /NCGR_PEP_ID=MMETSP0009_2-20130614/41520_1 /TAXON_ID=210454 /ORGANISM="Grammatophora oceanica, Strain CCMP 410" /LENGTH=45 /DNA_ID= /DNA_START= /DNA_END= /DNA_ORIENTATION=
MTSRQAEAVFIPSHESGYAVPGYSDKLSVSKIRDHTCRSTSPKLV